jgi:hypothetical protein
MSAGFDDRLRARFADQGEPAPRALAPFAAVRARAAGIERRRRRRRLALLAAAVIAVLAAVPAIAISRTLVERLFGAPVDPGLRDYIGLVLHTPAGASFAVPPHYVAGVRTSQGTVLLWAARRADGAQCTGVETAFGDERVKLAGRTVADNGITCSDVSGPLGSANAGLAGGQAVGSLHVAYGRVPARVRTVRVTYEDGRTRTLTPERGWVIVAFERDAERPGHRPIREQALDAGGAPLATVALNPWDYGGREPPPPRLAGPGSTLLTAVRTPAGRAELRLSAPGRGWEQRQCWGVVLRRRSTPVVCAYPASPGPAAASVNNLFLDGPALPGLVVVLATGLDHAWLVSADRSVRAARITRFALTGKLQIVIVAPTGSAGRALAGVVTSRAHRITGALLMASRRPGWTTTAPCFLAAPSAGAPAATPACRALMADARRAVARGAP